jgi:hypothetical protein
MAVDPGITLVTGSKFNLLHVFEVRTPDGNIIARQIILLVAENRTMMTFVSIHHIWFINT